MAIFGKRSFTRISVTGKFTLPRLMAASALVFVGFAACSAQVDEPDSSIGTREDALYYLSTSLWGQRNIPVCWETAGNATEKGWVKEVLTGQRSWSSAGDVNFTGWGNCTAGAPGIHLSGGASNVTTGGLGRHADGKATVELDFTASPQTAYSRCTTNGLSREQCIKTTAIHEFGHALGYAHEQNRGSPPADCSTSGASGSNGNDTFGTFDTEAIMAYCNFSTQLSSTERRGTERVYGPAFRDVRRLGDYDGDGKSDLLCFDVLSGNMFRDLASASGQFGGTDWTGTTGWCNGSDNRRLFVGDFDGNGRDDLLCFDMSTGSQWIDYASASGQFGGTDWSAANGWCNEANSRRLYVGDFDGNGRDDLLCYDRSSGSIWVDYANASGQFGGTDFSVANGWCNASASRRLYVGDFNGDGRDDLLCHDLDSGAEFVDYASSSGAFNGTDFSVAAGWCNFDGAELHIGDFNGDGRSDILCHSGSNGRRWIDYANSSGEFSGTDWTTTDSWCRANGSRLFVGDVNGDGRSDLVCHNVGSGQKWVDYADSSGHLDGTNWSLNDGWCNVDSRDLH